jgi:RNA polymerase sigma-70 factor (ECF subfamily)
MDEREAIELLQRGEIRGLEALVRQHQVRAIRTAYLVVRDAALAQDIVQAAFVRAYERIAQLDPARPFGPWFLTSVLHDALKAAARQGRTASLDTALDGEGGPAGALAVDPEPGPDALWERAETADEVWAALGTLTPEQRAAVVARYYLGLNQAEMAAVLACPPSTIKWRLHAARARLRLILTPLVANE